MTQKTISYVVYTSIKEIRSFFFRGAVINVGGTSLNELLGSVCLVLRMKEYGSSTFTSGELKIKSLSETKLREKSRPLGYQTIQHI